jgi:hypothetical protein
MPKKTIATDVPSIETWKKSGFGQIQLITGSSHLANGGKTPKGERMLLRGHIVLHELPNHWIV